MADELERRVRTLEEELNGERHVTRYAAEQARRGTEAFLGLRSEVALLRADTSQLRVDIATTTAHVDAFAETIAIVSTTLARHGRALDVLLQDVRELRTEATALRRDMEAINSRLDGLQQEVQQLRSEGTALRRDVEAINARLDGLQQDVRELRGGQDELRRGQDELRRGQDGLRSGQDGLRSGQDELRRGQGELHARLDVLQREQAAMREEAAARHAETMAAIRGALGGGALPAA
jgi:chromosome segregation ATPase